MNGVRHERPHVASLATCKRIRVILTAADHVLDDVRDGERDAGRRGVRYRRGTAQWHVEKACEGLWRAGIDWKSVARFRETGLAERLVGLAAAADLNPDDLDGLGSAEIEETATMLLALRGQQVRQAR